MASPERRSPVSQGSYRRSLLARGPKKPVAIHSAPDSLSAARRIYLAGARSLEERMAVAESGFVGYFPMGQAYIKGLFTSYFSIVDAELRATSECLRYASGLVDGLAETVLRGTALSKPEEFSKIDK